MEKNFDLEFKGIELRLIDNILADADQEAGERMRFTAAVEDREGNIYRAIWYASDDVPLVGAESEEWEEYIQRHGGDDLDFHDEYDYCYIAELELVQKGVMVIRFTTHKILWVVCVVTTNKKIFYERMGKDYGKGKSKGKS